MAVLDVSESECLLTSAAGVGSYLREELLGLQQNCEAMGDVRGCGLFVGVEWISDRESKTANREDAFDVANRLKEKGFLLSNAGALGNVIKIRPHLVFQKSHADLFLTAFSETLHEIESAGQFLNGSKKDT